MSHPEPSDWTDQIVLWVLIALAAIASLIFSIPPSP